MTGHIWGGGIYGVPHTAGGTKAKYFFLWPSGRGVIYGAGPGL